MSKPPAEKKWLVIKTKGEENVDRLAHSLYALVVDNPEMFGKPPSETDGE